MYLNTLFEFLVIARLVERRIIIEEIEYIVQLFYYLLSPLYHVFGAKL